MGLRPSDVFLQASKVLGSAAQAAGGIGADLYEADRVTQVNRGLAEYERAMQGYFSDFSRRSFDVTTILETRETGTLSATVPMRLGEMTQADVDADYTKFVESQIENMTKNVRNPDAKKELMQHLQMGAIRNRGKALGEWSVAADHEALANFNKLAAVVMESDLPPDEKVQRITSRVDEMVRTGRMWKDEGEAIILKTQDTARYSHAYNGAMAAMKESEDPAAAEAWLNENTPYYDGNPDARAKVLNAVRREYDYLLNVEERQRRRVDDEADEAMQSFFAKNYTDPIALQEHLSTPENKYSDRMISETFTKWQGLISRLMAAEDKPGPDGNEARAAWIATRPYATPGEKEDALREALQDDPVLLAKWLAKDLNKLADPMMREGVEALENLYAPRIAKAGTKTPEWTALTKEQDARIKLWFEEIEALDRKGDKDQTRALLEDLRSEILDEYIADAFTTRHLKPDTPLTVNPFEDLLRVMSLGGRGQWRALNAENLLKLEGGTVEWFERNFGGQASGVEPMPDGRTMLFINDHLMTLRYDEATKSAVAQTWDQGRWVDVPVPESRLSGVPVADLTDEQLADELKSDAARDRGVDLDAVAALRAEDARREAADRAAKIEEATAAGRAVRKKVEEERAKEEDEVKRRWWQRVRRRGE